jgi:hypothetical protein
LLAVFFFPRVLPFADFKEFLRDAKEAGEPELSDPARTENPV